MKRILIASLLMASTVSAHASDWSITPKIYSRGGFTQSADLTAKGTDLSDGDNGKIWNMGAWGDESNAFMKNLTEIDMVSNYKDLATFVYGIDVDSSQRWEESDGTKPVNERQAYLEFHKIFNGKGDLWFGRRAYRGFGDLMTGSFPLDEKNMYGFGLKLPVGPGQWEFAYSTYDANAEGDSARTKWSTEENFTTNIYINKYILPIKDGNVTVNTEIHQNNSKDSDNDSISYMAGAQYARWNMKLFGAGWYNIFVLNYSNGNINEGMMRSVFNSTNKDEKASKVLFKIGGDLKTDKWSTFYNFRYQKHMGDDSSEDWQFTDILVRPMYALTGNVGIGIDYIQRLVIKEGDALKELNWGAESNNPAKANMWRAGLMLNYHLNKGGHNLFQNAEISVLAGRIHKQVANPFFQGRGTQKDANFLRFKYTIEI